MGHTALNQASALAARPAPVQVNYLGYPGTIGADFLDYIIVDRFVAPADLAPCFTEKFVYLPDSYQPNDRRRPYPRSRPARSDCGLPERGFVFGCLNDVVKITPQMFEIWMRLLRAVPDSILWLLEPNAAATANLRREAVARAIDPARLVFAPRASHEDHLARQALADLFLDTLPYNAHTTASDALWMGIPIVTCMGKSFAARVCASVLHAAGAPDLVTHSLEEYEALALVLAKDGQRLRHCARASSPIATARRYSTRRAIARISNPHLPP